MINIQIYNINTQTKQKQIHMFINLIKNLCQMISNIILMSDFNKIAKTKQKKLSRNLPK